MLGGAGGATHCVIPEACELIVDRSEDGAYQFQVIDGQSEADVLERLGHTWPESLRRRM